LSFRLFSKRPSSLNDLLLLFIFLSPSPFLFPSLLLLLRPPFPFSQARAVTVDLCKSIGGAQTSGRGIRGLVVDPAFSVLGVANVRAIGDCAVVPGCAPTAQAAFQQGKYLGRLLRETGLDAGAASSYPPFVFRNQGALAYVGASEGVAELKTALWSNHPAEDGGGGSAVVEGKGAFAIWRSLYFSKLLSGKNRWMVGFDWASLWFGGGRSISSQHSMGAGPGGEREEEQGGAAAAAAAGKESGAGGEKFGGVKGLALAGAVGGAVGYGVGSAAKAAAGK